MTRYTFETATTAVEDLAAKEVVFKAEVADMKYVVSHAYDGDRNKLGEAHTHAGKWQNLTLQEQALDAPYELRHLFGKKFGKELAALPDTPYSRDLKALQVKWCTLFVVYTSVIERAVAGRRPPEPKEVTGYRTQHRATCAACFRDQAIYNNGAMVEHGFTLDGLGWGRNGVCFGSNRSHFGCEDGVGVTKYLRDSAIKSAEASDLAAEMLRTGKAVPHDKGKPIENATAKQIASAVARQVEGAIQQRAHAAFLTEKITTWTPQEPREVQVPVYA